MHNSELAAPAVASRAWIDLGTADAATACVDIAANRFVISAGTAVRLAAPAAASLRVVGAATAAALSAANGGAPATFDTPGGAASAVVSCR
jgi:hypothetical protein